MNVCSMYLYHYNYTKMLLKITMNYDHGCEIIYVIDLCVVFGLHAEFCTV